ncbi:MAG TPA: hypothetical protein VHC22_29400 [Pirellulales bacterium]|nr:hypothetical protein [Pirellulales bacterium]
MPKQFSIRLMLTVVTVLCIALSAWVVPAERQRRAVTAIQAVGGKVEYVSNDAPAAETFLRRWLPQDYFDDVDTVLLGRRTRVTHATLPHLEALPRLRRLWLDDPLITDAGLVHLQGLTHLEELGLNDTRVTDAGLAHLRGLRNLRILWLIRTQVARDGVARLQKALPGCMIHSDARPSLPFGPQPR